MMLNDFQPAPDPSWGFIVEHYPGALVDLAPADGGFVRDGAWYSAAYLARRAGAAVRCSAAARAAAPRAHAAARRGAVAGCASVLVIPIFSAFRLELVLRADGRLRARPRAPSAWPSAARRLSLGRGSPARARAVTVTYLAEGLAPGDV